MYICMHTYIYICGHVYIGDRLNLWVCFSLYSGSHYILCRVQNPGQATLTSWTRSPGMASQRLCLRLACCLTAQTTKTQCCLLHVYIYIYVYKYMYSCIALWLCVYKLTMSVQTIYR